MGYVSRLPGAFAAALLSFAATGYPGGLPETRQVEDLAAQGQFASAAQLLHSGSLVEDPRRLRTFTRLLVDNYIITINFELFALKDLEEGETVAALRGTPGEYEIPGGSLEELLHAAYTRDPSSPHVNYAVGYYLSRAAECGCGQRRLFTGKDGDIGKYFRVAEQGGEFDAWSLLQLGVAEQSGQPPDLESAMVYYRRALSLDSRTIPAHFNLAGILLWKDNLAEAKRHAEMALDGYDNPEQNADTHTLLGRIFLAEGKPETAEKQYRRALGIQNWNARAFSSLIGLLREQGRSSEYVDVVLDYIAIDFANSYLFNMYVTSIMEAGFWSADRKVEEKLLQLDLNDAQAGAVYFNLGRLAEMRTETGEALERYRHALAAFRKVAEPPEGAVPALEQRILRLTAK